jgi:succinate dehydrogenase/fumarate reductase cytochrome b subunit
MFSLTTARSMLGRATRIALGLFIALFFAATTVLLTYEALAPRAGKRPLPALAVIAFTVVCAILSLYGLDHVLTGIRPTRTRWLSGMFSKRTERRATIAVWAVLVLLLAGFLSVLTSTASSRVGN